MSQFLKMAAKYFKGSLKEKKTKGKVVSQNVNLSTNEEEKQEEEVVVEVEVEEKEKEVKKENEKEGQIKNSGKLFVGGLSLLTTTKGLNDYFSRFGKVADSFVPKHSGKSRGFGFITFSNPEDAKAVLEFGIHVLDNKIVEVKPFSEEKFNHSKFSERKEEARVFLGGLPYDITEENLRQFFLRYGEVEDVFINRDKNTNEPKGYGFLTFKDIDAANLCEAEGFVFLSGRRVQIKKAHSRNYSKTTESLSISSNSDRCVEEALNMDVEENYNENETVSVISGKDDLIIENPVFKELLENYFLEKLKNFNTMNCHNSKSGNQARPSQESKVIEVEKLLEDFLACNENLGAFDANLIEFSSDSEFEGESEEGTTSETDEDVSGSLLCETNLVKELQKLNTKSETALESESKPSSEGNSGSLKSSVYDDTEFGIQNSWPLQIKSKEGFLMCSLCQWISPNESTACFLNHCKTSIHRTKLKERFRSKQVQDKLEILSSQTMKLRPEIDSVPKLVSEKPSIVSVTNVEKRQNKQNNKQYQNSRSRTTKQQTCIESNKGKDAEQKKEAKTEAIRNLKIRALSKHMKCIQPFSENGLMCKMCNKIIPEALEFSSLMKNVSSHLQSKKHLKNLLKIEQSMKACKKNSISTTDKVNRNQNNPTVQEKKILGDKVKKAIKPKGDPAKPNLQGVPEVKNSKVATNNSREQKKNKKKPATSAASEAKFLCLPCNLACQSIELFDIHLGLKSHLDNLNCKNLKADNLSINNMAKCKGCDIYLCGSLYHINKHYSKCVEKKN